MHFRFSFKRLALGAVAGAMWGLAAMLVNSLSGVFIFENGFAHNLVVFTFGGAVFGVVVAGLLSAAAASLPFRRWLPKAMIVSASVWVVLRLGGAMLSRIESERFHLDTPQTLQGLVLAVMLGAILGLLLDGTELSRGASK